MDSTKSTFHTCFIIILITQFTQAVSPDPVSSSRWRVLDQYANTLPSACGLRTTLTHIDSGKNLTKLERFRRGVERGRARLQRLNAVVHATTDHQGRYSTSTPEVEVPVVHGNSEYLMTLAIGTPPSTLSAIMDTGSDLIWTQCQPCTRCFGQNTPIFDPSKSSSFSTASCASPQCNELRDYQYANCNAYGGCEYSYFYGDNSFTRGVLATETFTFDEASIRDVAFGCGSDNEGAMEGAGLVGLGRGPLSLVSQMKERKFSYCLTSTDDVGVAKTSTLLVGSLASIDYSAPGAAIKTTLSSSRRHPSYYYLGIQGISVGGFRLPINLAIQNDGSGGMIIDSGTTLTLLEPTAFRMVRDQFASHLQIVDDHPAGSTTPSELCFALPADLQPPSLVFHFQGADLELPPENYMIPDDNRPGVACLAMDSLQEPGGPSIFGNVQQRNFLVSYDIDNEIVSFLPTQCGDQPKLRWSWWSFAVFIFSLLMSA